jgi:hypothetical protein
MCTNEISVPSRSRVIPTIAKLASPGLCPWNAW